MESLVSSLYQALPSQENPMGLLAFGVAVLIAVPYFLRAFSILFPDEITAKAPRFGVRLFLEPRFVSRYRFFHYGKLAVDEGYRKCKDTMFRFVRSDVDMLVLSNKYLNELRTMPKSVLNPSKAHALKILAPFTYMDIITETDLHLHTIQSKLTPNLGAIVGKMQDELKFAMVAEFPKCKDEWVTTKPAHTILQILARMSARVFIGLPICRSEEWLEISTQFTESVFETVVILRLFPRWLYPLVSRLLPSRRRLATYINRAYKLLVPEITRRQQVLNQKKKANLTDDGPDLMSWMIEGAKNGETDPRKLAQLELVVSLAAIHTTQMAVIHTLFDLCAHPEYFEPLREEIEEVLENKGGVWDLDAFNKLWKLDSFMKESQRVNPPSLLSFQRVVMQPVQLSDGTLLPAGTQFCMPAQAIQNDPSNTVNPSEFDGFRYYRFRQIPTESQQHQFATAAQNVLNFGYGKDACPGRFFASLAIKSLLVEILMRYDVKFPDGKGRPKNMSAYEYIFPDPDAEISFRERRDVKTDV